MKDNSDPLYAKHRDADFAKASAPKDVLAMARLHAVKGTKTRITMRIDNKTLAIFKARAEMTGNSYQTLLNDALRQVAEGQPLEAVVREAIRQELRAH